MGDYINSTTRAHHGRSGGGYDQIWIQLQTEGQAVRGDIKHHGWEGHICVPAYGIREIHVLHTASLTNLN